MNNYQNEICFSKKKKLRGNQTPSPLTNLFKIYAV